jgi:LL-diaminopimelate aminotransferase
MPRLNPTLTTLATYPAVELERRKRAVIAAGQRLFDFSVGDPTEPTPPFIRQALIDAVGPHCGYPSVRGQPAVRQAITGYLARRFGVELDPETQVLPTSGSKEAVFHTPLLVIDPSAPDRGVAFPDPGYPAYQRGALFAGGDAVPVRLSGDHIFRPWTLPSDVVSRLRMVWLNSPHNPSGAVTSLADLQRAADFCREHDILLVADESYADVWVRGEPPPSLLQAGVDGLLVLHSLSKRSGMTGYRSGFLAGDATLIRHLVALRSNPGLVAQDFVNAAATAAWSDDAHVGERRALVAQKHALLCGFFQEAGIEIVASQAGLYLWLRTPGGRTDEGWALELLDHGIVVSPGGMFGVAGGGVGFVRVALVPSLEEIRAAIDVWRRVL